MPWFTGPFNEHSRLVQRQSKSKRKVVKDSNGDIISDTIEVKEENNMKE
jgi:hypothetical protein